MKEKYLNLIIDYLKNRLSDEELTVFYAWLEADKQNKELYFEAKAIYDACLSANRPMDLDKSWQRLLAKKNKDNTRFYSLIRYVMPYAAVLFFAILLTSTYFLYILEKDNDMPAIQYIGGDGLRADMIVMSDGTQVNMGTNSKFHYEKEYGKTTRTVFLEGEAYFEVAEDKKRPFIVKLDRQEIEVLGTKFNVTAYPGDSVFTTTLLEGAVSMSTMGINEKSILSPGQQLVYNRNSGIAEVKEVSDDSSISWVSGYYQFKEQPLEKILDRLSQVYNTRFTINSDKLKNIIFTGTFYRGQNAKDVMEIVNMSIPIRYKIERDCVFVFEK